MSGQEFGKRSQKSGKFPTFGRADGLLVASFLRRLYPIKTAAAVEAYEGIPAHRFRKWEQGCAPSWTSMALLIMRHGPEFLCAVLPASPDWLDEAARDRRQHDLELDIAAKRRELEMMIAAR